jgi:hypothetical protein
MIGTVSYTVISREGTVDGTEDGTSDGTKDGTSDGVADGASDVCIPGDLSTILALGVSAKIVSSSMISVGWFVSTVGKRVKSFGLVVGVGAGTGTCTGAEVVARTGAAVGLMTTGGFVGLWSFSCGSWWSIVVIRNMQMLVRGVIQLSVVSDTNEKVPIKLLTLLGLAPPLAIMALGLFGVGFCAILLIPQLVILFVTFDVVVIITFVFASSNALAISFAFAFFFALSFTLSSSTSLSTLETHFANALINVRHRQLERNDIFDILHWNWDGNLSLLKIKLGGQYSIGSNSKFVAARTEPATCSSGRKVG